MKGALGLLALAGAALAKPMPQGVTSAIAPASSAPPGCSPNYPGTFQITVVNVTNSPSKRDLETRQDGTLLLTLNNGILLDAQGRTGSIVANHQFQFDKPAQAGAIYTAGWSVCQNGSLAIGGNAIFWQCLSGNFYNLYDKSQGGQCGAIYIVVLGGSAPASPAAPTRSVSQVTDGQPQASTGRPVSQISDGQPQASTGKPAVTQISDGQLQVPTGRPVSQISDGQIQATTAKPAVSQISDGQVQATTAKPAVSQISDGQVQATTAKPVTTAKPAVSQISDGQVQATTAKPAVSQISDGQVQATTAKPVSQITDGQVQAPTSAAATSTAARSSAATSAAATSSAAPATFTGAAHREMAGSFAMVAGIVGAVAIL